jgi:hypothetical protein
MVRNSSIVLGLCLVALFFVGLGVATWTTWLTWFDLIVGLFTLFVAYSADAEAPSAALVGGPALAAIFTLALWIVGLATGAHGTQVWLNFAAAVCLFAVSVMAAGEQPQPARKTFTGPDQWRKSA